MRSNLASIMLLSFMLAGCGSESDNSSTSTIYMAQGENLSTYTQNLSVDPNTPEGVGTLLTLHDGLYNQRNVGLCTWFLVGKNHAMTNSHCIPDALKENKNLTCGDYLQGGFQTKSGFVKVRCKKLIHASDISQPTVLNNDYALLELEKDIEDSATFNLDRRGIAENEKVKILTMNHHQVSSGVYSIFKEHNCLMKSSDILGKIASSGASPLAGFKEEGTTELCKTIEGNSGSPVIDESGRLVAILHGGIKQGYDLNQGMRVSSNKLTNNISIVTNLRCQKFNDSNFDADYPEACKDEKKAGRLDKEKLVNELQPKLIKNLEDALAKQPSYLEYNMETKPKGSGSLVSIRPKCIKPLNQWDEKNLNEIETEGFFIKKKKINAVIGEYWLEYITSLDYYGNFGIDIKLRDSRNIRLQITGLHELDKKGEVTSAMNTNFLGLDNTIEIKIPKCEQTTGTSNTK